VATAAATAAATATLRQRAERRASEQRCCNHDRKQPHFDSPSIRPTTEMNVPRSVWSASMMQCGKTCIDECGSARDSSVSLT
jgi:wobble nucleotide-excising tRNase